MIFATTIRDVLTPVIYVSVLVVLAVGFLFLNDFIFGRCRKRGAADASVKRFEERLLNPDFGGLEKHFGRALPQGLKALYGNREEILKENVQVIGTDAEGNKRTWDIAFFQPADLENVREAWPDTKEVFEFANDGCGNGFTIDPK